MEIRRYGRGEEILPIPDLTELQIKSYEEFLQADKPATERDDLGLEAIIREIYPIESYDKTMRLVYLGYELGKPRYTPNECRLLKQTYGMPFKVRIRLEKAEPVEEDVYLGEIPKMIGGGEFIVNGAERVIVSQLHRSPGVDFSVEVQPGEKKLHSCWVIPERGSWIEINVTKKDVLHVKIDQSGKFLATTIIRAFDAKFASDAEIIRLFHPTKKFKLNNKAALEKLKGAYVVGDLRDPESDEVLVTSGEQLSDEFLKIIGRSDLKEIEVIDGQPKDLLILNTLREDSAKTYEDALLKIYQRFRPGNPPALEKAKALFEEKFRDKSRYRLGKVGRFRLNRKFNQKVAEDEMTLTAEDFVNSVKYIIALRGGEGDVDDIDHLGNRRVRTICELAAEEFRKGFLKLRKTAQERMNIEKENLTPRTLINAKTISSAIDYFFGRGELSQVVDQTNPLSQLTHERRLSALGPGGLNRKRAGFEVRDVHISHYGRICPIETPEGPNIGLINSLALYARTNEYGFIETPYRRVKDGKVAKEIEFLSAIEEGKYVIAQANAELDKGGHFVDELVSCRHRNEFTLSGPDKIEYIDVAPSQIVSVAASLIPFLEHDDANRALMGSNMQRQAVPCLRAEKPLVGTGIERTVAIDSGTAVQARRGGRIDYVDAGRIVVRVNDSETSAGKAGVDIYNLTKYTRSNQNTNINQRPLVKVGDQIAAGDVIADGASTDMGELAPGQNLLVAFMPWNGYNFEDSILISERVVAEDRYTSIHIEELVVVARDTKLGPEEITRDISNLSERMLARLDESGIVYIGAEVEAGDVLVGKVTPKGETQLTPEEKLLRAIFGEKASDVKDTSLRVPSGISGTVIDVQVFTREGIERDKRAAQIIDDELKGYRKDLNDQLRIVENDAFARIEKLLLGKAVNGGPKRIAKGTKIAADYLEGVNRYDWFDIRLADEEAARQLEAMKDSLSAMRLQFDAMYELKKKKLTQGDELPPGVQKMVKVYVAVKRRLQPGDKMAGRHGNKGVVSKIVPVEDMPYMADGQPVDIVLNPLGVPSRMNVGQILEVHLGWAAKGLGAQIDAMLKAEAKVADLRRLLDQIYNGAGRHEALSSLGDGEIRTLAQNLTGGVPFATPVFDGANEDEIKAMLELAGLPRSGQIVLHDGRTGEAFDRPVTVGYMHVLKLHHLVDDKMHARSTGPYSLVTQQPLGGKAQFGGQRFGEMEVWALEAYGAAYTLQEMLTVKSDDVNGRTKVYENIVKGEHKIEAGMPESFNVLVKEIRSLAIDIDLERF